VDTDTLKLLRRWRTIALILLVGSAVRSWLGADSRGGVFTAVVCTVLTVAMCLVALSEVRREARQARR